jgi:hypothetical protein
MGDDPDVVPPCESNGGEASLRRRSEKLGKMLFSGLSVRVDVCEGPTVSLCWICAVGGAVARSFRPGRENIGPVRPGEGELGTVDGPSRCKRRRMTVLTSGTAGSLKAGRAREVGLPSQLYPHDRVRGLT